MKEQDMQAQQAPNLTIKMKKKIAAFLVMCLALLVLSACGTAVETETSEPPSYADVLTKNNINTLLESNECVIWSQLNMVSGGVSYLAYYKGNNGENCLIAELNGYSSYYNDEMSLVIHGADVSMDISARKDSILLFEEESILPKESEHEPLTLDENGNYICKYKIEVDEGLAAIYEGIWPCQAGDFIVTTAVIDAQTLLVQRMDSYLEYAKTGKTEYISLEIIRFGQQPKMPYALERLLGGETHTVTLTLSDGTVRSYAVPAEASVGYYAEEGEQLYADEAKTVPYAFPDGPLDEDVSLYSR